MTTPTTPIVAALLGPAGPQIGCDECFELLDGYVEQQIDGRRRRRGGSRDAHPPRRLPRLPRGARVAAAPSSLGGRATMRRPRPARFDVVVVGGGVAAGACVSTLRDGGYDGTITVACAEPHPPYTRPGLTKQVLRGEKPPEAALWRPAEWYREQSVELLTGATVDGDRSRAARPCGSPGARVRYGSLVLATGAEPRHLAFGDELAGPRPRAALVRRCRRHPAPPGRGHALARDRRRLHRRRVRRLGRAHRAATSASSCRSRSFSRAPSAPAVGELVRRPPAPARRPHPRGHDRRAPSNASRTVCSSRLADGSELTVDRIVAGAGVTPSTRLAERRRASISRSAASPSTRACARAPPASTRSATSPPTRASCTGGACGSSTGTSRAHTACTSRARSCGPATGRSPCSRTSSARMGDWAFLEYAGLGGGRAVFRGDAGRRRHERRVPRRATTCSPA